jgi:hypothetical protein
MAWHHNTVQNTSTNRDQQTITLLEAHVYFISTSAHYHIS